MERGQQHILLEAGNVRAAKYFTFLSDTSPDSKMYWKPDTEVTQCNTFPSGDSALTSNMSNQNLSPSHTLTSLHSLNLGSHDLGALPASETYPTARYPRCWAIAPVVFRGLFTNLSPQLRLLSWCQPSLQKSLPALVEATHCKAYLIRVVLKHKQVLVSLQPLV